MTELYLVGGAVRDSLFGKQPADYDYAFVGSYSQLVEWLANANAVQLIAKPEHNTIKAKLKSGQVADFIAISDISSNLAERDFTINAMANRLPIDENALLDPFSGQIAMECGFLSQVKPDSVFADPIRAIRAVRFCLQYCLRPDAQLAKVLKSQLLVYEWLLNAERKRQELNKLFKLGSGPAFSKMQELVSPQLIEVWLDGIKLEAKLHG